MRNRRAQRRVKYIALLGGKCQNCGSRKELEFDHKDAKKKEFDLNDIRDGAENVILKELKKCVLLCRKCHLLKTRLNQDFINKDKAPARHGSIWFYKSRGCRCAKCRRAMRKYYLSKKKRC